MISSTLGDKSDEYRQHYPDDDKHFHSPSVQLLNLTAINRPVHVVVGLIHEGNPIIAIPASIGDEDVVPELDLPEGMFFNVELDPAFFAVVQTRITRADTRWRSASSSQ
jgi:hypothetical protein